MSSCMRVEERWKVLCCSDKETFLHGYSLASSMALVICDGLLKRGPASMFFASLPRRFSDLFGFLGL